MVAAMFQQDLETEYGISQRACAALSTGREKSSRDRFHTAARYRRGGKRQGPATSAHRRNATIN
jgi:hypothetical protein